MIGAAPPRCPDNLLARRSAGGQLSAVEQRALAAHIAGCASCAAADILGRAFDEIPADPQAGDAALIARVTAAAVAGRRRAERPRRGSRAVAAAAAVLLLSGLAGVAIAWVSARVALRMRLFAVPSPAAAPSSPSLSPPQVPRSLSDGAPAPRAPSSSLASSAAPPAPPIVAAARLAVSPSAAIAAPAVPAAPSPRARIAALAGGQRSLRSPADAAPAVVVQGAAELFAAANAARRGGERREAAELYQRLQRLHPGSEEAAQSLVSSADNYARLERPAEALADLDRYLAQRPAGTLTQEALFARARCLAALHRQDDERAAWQELVRRFPGSVYEPAALHRLDEIGR